MNIFILDRNPKKAAISHCDKHVVKMILESCQMLCNAHYIIGKGQAPYKETHTNHPCTIWSRTSKQNYLWLLSLTYNLLSEYKHRYKKIHKSTTVYKWCRKNINNLKFDYTKQTNFICAMPDIYKVGCPIQSYRNYYLGEKLQFCHWTNRKIPLFVSNHV